MGVGDPIFVDTNVLIYASRPHAPQHGAARAALIRLRAGVHPLWISRQVLREYLAAATRPQPSGPAPPMAAAIADVRRFRLAFNLAEEGDDVFDRLLHLLAAHPGAGRQVHDANSVATMLACGISRLLTFNVARRRAPDGADFHRFGALITLEPVGATST